MDKLSEKQTSVVNSFLQQVGKKRNHLKIALVGAHSHGFASPDSDVDLKGIHINPTDSFLGIETRGGLHFNTMETIDGVEIDYTSNELQTVVGKLLSGGGNFLEILMAPESLEVPCSDALEAPSTLLPELQELAIKNLTQKYYNHYKGFAMGQSKRIATTENAPIKCYLYVIRLCLTGAHLLLEKKVETNIHTLGGIFDIHNIGSLVAEKKQEMSSTSNLKMLKDAEKIMKLCYKTLDDAIEKSPLPRLPPAKGELNDWLVNTRRNLF